jgi:hypothetical protein
MAALNGPHSPKSAVISPLDASVMQGWRYLGGIWRGRSSVGRAPQSHCGGQGFKSPRLHQLRRKALKNFNCIPDQGLSMSLWDTSMVHKQGITPVSNQHLQRRNGVYYYRRRVPLHLVAKLGKKFVQVSLHTTSLKEEKTAHAARPGMGRQVRHRFESSKWRRWSGSADNFTRPAAFGKRRPKSRTGAIVRSDNHSTSDHPANLNLFSL